MATTTNVVIIPGRMNSYATVVRACINEVTSFARTGNTDDLEDAIARMRRNLTRLETEARLVAERD